LQGGNKPQFHKRIDLSAASKCRFAWRRLLRIAPALLWLLAAQAQASPEPAIEVEVRIRGEEVLVDVNFHVRATPQEAWAVMTDYGHATEFISKLEKSVILSRTENVLLVSQKGRMGWGLISVPLETVTEVHLTPFEKMQGRLVSGNMKKSESTTRLIADAAGTRVAYHLESIPEAWIPPLIGRGLVELETRARFRELVAEILRRKALSQATR
jgi:hypothetical protein